MKAFSLLEILIGLTIIGIILTFPDWSQFNKLISNRDDDIRRQLQLSILSGLAKASGIPNSPFQIIDMPSSCGSAEIKISAGGIVQKSVLNCHNLALQVSATGSVRVKP